MEFSTENMDGNGNERNEKFVLNDGVGMETRFIEVNNVYTGRRTSLADRADIVRILFQNVFRLAIGSLCGSVLMFEAIMRRTVWRDKYEVIYVAPNHVLIKPLNGDYEPVSIISKYDTEIDDVRIMGM